LLALLFIGLRLSGVITWPWIWVLSPLWIPLALGLFLLVGAGLVFLVAAFWMAKSGQRSKNV
jgi:hypothetical protein